MKTCAFTGHRPQNLPFGFNEEDERCIDLKKTLREQIINLIENEGVTHFISGMAIGVDMYAAEIVLGLKASYPGITLESAIPCESQAAKWSEALRDRYFDIASKCDKETLIQTHYVPFPVSWTVKMKKKQKETQDILSYHTQAAGCSDKARAKASGGRQPIEECGRTGL